MKKLIFIIAVFGFLFAFKASATHSLLIIPRPPQSNIHPDYITNSWGLNNTQTPKIAGGTSVKDEQGVNQECPIFIRTCADITKTEWYRSNMLKTAKMILDKYGSSAYLTFPYLKGWYDIVR